jgi:hypothetical protein
MRRALVTIPDDVEAALERYLQRQDEPTDLDHVVADALRDYLARPHVHRRKPPGSPPPFWVTPVEEKDAQGEPDVSINHDHYLTRKP